MMEKNICNSCSKHALIDRSVVQCANKINISKTCTEKNKIIVYITWCFLVTVCKVRCKTKWKKHA